MKTVLFFLFSACAVFGQGASLKGSHENHFKLYGKLIEMDPINGGEMPAENAQVVVYKDNEIFVAFFAGKAGAYEFYLPAGHTYDVWYGGSAFVNKIVKIDATKCPGARANKNIKLDMGLFRPIEGMEFPSLTEPFVTVEFDKEYGTLVPDIEYAEERMMLLDKAFRKAKKAGIIEHN